MTNGYSHYNEVEKVLASLIELAGPGEVLSGRAETARDRFRQLGYASECSAADDLMRRLADALDGWPATRR